MGSETVIQRICFRNSCGLFLRDFVTIKLEMLLIFVLNLILVNKYC